MAWAAYCPKKGIDGHLGVYARRRERVTAPYGRVHPVTCRLEVNLEAMTSNLLAMASTLAVPFVAAVHFCF